MKGFLLALSKRRQSGERPVSHLSNQVPNKVQSFTAVVHSPCPSSNLNHKNMMPSRTVSSLSIVLNPYPRITHVGVVKRNPHPDFKAVEASRVEFDTTRQFRFTKTPKPDWKPGSGADDGGACLKKNHVEIDPYAPGRPSVSNYKLLISGIIPRPIGFVSTRSADGSSTNIAPFSYTNVVNHDPPVFTIGYAGGFDSSKDSLKNLGMMIRVRNERLS